MVYYIYILECINGNYYTGYTSNMERRYQEHLSGSIKCKYTRSFPPMRLAACWRLESSLSVALKIEHKIKQLSKTAKKKLIEHPKQLAIFLSLQNIVIALETYQTN